MSRLPVPVPHFSPAHRDLVWRAIRPDPDGILVPAGVLIAESTDGVVLTVADDHRNRVLVLDPDHWADLCDAVKSGLLDGVLGGRIMCEDPNRPLNPATAAPVSGPAISTSALGLLSA
ncbi:hypothetical protein [Kitasatospora sp. NPDC048407]|uniref:hypothetical protein n=1 Tax=Kitasatospora sp. NPDC048407 TaxID=3364051 RepID=UPI003715FF84